MSQFIEVLEFLDPSGQVMCQRTPPNDSGEIKYGAQLVVQENQVAVFVKDGKFLDVFKGGRHTLVTENIPILTKLLSLPYNFKSPFRASVYFVSQSDFTNLKWGTAEPLTFKDSEFQYVRLRARGVYSIRIADPAVFIGKIVGTAGRYVVSQLEDFLRNTIVAQFFDALGSNLTTVLDLPKIYEELGLLTLNQVRGHLEKYGLELLEVKILAINLPEDVQRAIDERSAMAAAGDLNKYMKFKAAQSLPEMASGNGGGVGRAAVDVGMGVAMGQMMAGAFRESMNDAAGHPEPARQGVDSQAACKKCGTSHPPAAKFCMNCGEKISPPGFCDSCSPQYPAGAKFCMSCGGKLE